MDVDALLAAYNAAPKLDPQMLYGVSQSAPDVSTAVVNAQATAGFGSAVTFANNLRHHSGADQRRMWSAMSSTDQQQLSATGYAPPKSRRSLWQDVGMGVHDVFNALGSPLRAVQHAYRTTHVLGEAGLSPADQLASGKQPGINPRRVAESFGAVFDLHQWAKSWNDTEHGERSYDPALLRDIQRRVDPATFTLAKQIADAGKDRAKLVAIPRLYPADQQQQISDRMHNDKTVTDTVAELEGSKLSVGRQFVGEQNFVKHPEFARLLSGTADAAFDWFGDPTQAIGGIKEAADARYVIGGAHAAEAIDRISQYKGAQRALGEIDQFLKAGDYQGMVRRFPTLAKVAQPMADAGVGSKEAFVDWLKGSALTESWLSGRGGVIGRAGTMFPHAGVVSDMAAAAKIHMTNVVDWLDQSHVPVGSQVGGFLARVSKIVPRALEFDPAQDNAPEIVRQVAEMGLPRRQADMLMNDYYRAASVGGRRNIYKSVLGTVFDQVGLNDTPEGARYVREFLSRLDDHQLGRLYSTVVDDQLLIDGKEVASGIGANQVFGKWAVPDPKVLLAAKNKMTLPGQVLTMLNRDGVEAFMQQGWKPLQLLRLGFAPRVAGEELFGALVRDGATGLVRARLADSSVKGLNSDADRILPWHPLTHVWSAMTDHLDEGAWKKIADAVDKPREVFAQILGDRARRAFRHVEGALAGGEYEQAAREMFDRYGPRMLTDEVSAAHSNGIDHLQTPETMISQTKLGVKKKAAYLATGEFKAYKVGDPLYAVMLKKNLDEIATDPLFKAALADVGNRDAQVDTVFSLLDSDTSLARRLRARASRATLLPDGRLVGVDATREEALRDWAGKVVDHVNGHLGDHEGSPVPGLVDALRAGKAPTVPELGALPESRLPRAVKGPEMVHVAGPNFYQNVLTKGFSEMVGRPMDWMARQPMFLHNYVLARREIMPLAAELGGSPQVVAHLTDVAFEKALNRTIPFIHDPELKSQFAVNVRNLMPFEFAQEQFYKRWAKTFVYAPDAFRKAMLISQGVRHSGLVQTDVNGNETFHYPIMGLFQQDVLVPALRAFGVNAPSLPILPGFSGDVKMATPGLERLGAPSFGPFVSFPLKEMARHFPELVGPEKSLLGAGADTPLWQDFVPTSLARLYQVVASNHDNNAEYASAFNQSVQYLEASGHGMPQDISPNDPAYQQWINRVKNYTRIVMLTRVLTGFVGPATPTIDIDYKHMRGRLAELMQQLPLNEAMAQLVREQPDATPYTVFGSVTPSKAGMPATAETLDFINQHTGFLKSYPLAAGWLIPQSAGKFDATAYTTEMHLGLREKKDAGTFVNDVLYAEAARSYFPSLDAYEKAKVGVHGPRLARLDKAFKAWQTSFEQSHPVFADMLNSHSSRLERQQIVEQLGEALNDPRVPQTELTEPTRILVGSLLIFQEHKTQLTNSANPNAAHRLRRLENEFATWGARFAAANPVVQGLYDRIVRPEIGGSVAAAQALTENVAGDQMKGVA